MKEIWKNIEDYEGLYQVSNLGRVKSLFRECKHPLGGKRKVNERIMKLEKTKWGYLRVHLNKNGKGKKLLVHRLVAKAFIPNPNNYKMVNHKNQNPKDNCVKNLEWCNVQYNNTYGDKIQKMCKTIVQLDKEGKIIKYFSSTIEASKETNITRCTITNCLNGNQKTAGGFIWKKGSDFICQKQF